MDTGPPAGGMRSVSDSMPAAACMRSPKHGMGSGGEKNEERTARKCIVFRRHVRSQMPLPLPPGGNQHTDPARSHPCCNTVPQRRTPSSSVRTGSLCQRSLDAIPPWMGSKTEITCKAMQDGAHYRHLRVDWVGERATESITLCGIKNEDSGSESALCPSCARVRDALNVCGFGPESLREVFDTLREIGHFRGGCEDGGASRSGEAPRYAGSVASQLKRSPGNPGAVQSLTISKINRVDPGEIRSLKARLAKRC